jgi:RHS repeat-associated protein
VEREPYGAVYSVRAGAERHQPLALPGQEDGGELSYNIFRWYRAGWGRYTQSDPIGLRGGLNLFGYVHGNPIRFADPTGLVCGIDVWTEEVTYALDYGYDSGFKSNWGHQWITWPGGSAGFWPNPTPETPVQSVPGMVQIPDPKTKTKTKSEYKKSDTYFDAFKACPNCDATLKCVSNAALALQASPPNYCLVGYNCYSFVAEILGKCGLTTTSTFEQLESQK